MTTTLEREVELRTRPPAPRRFWIGLVAAVVVLAAVAVAVFFATRTSAFTAQDLAALEDQIVVTVPTPPAFTAQSLAALEDQIVVTVPAPPAFTAQDLAALEDLVGR